MLIEKETPREGDFLSVYQFRLEDHQLINAVFPPVFEIRPLVKSISNIVFGLLVSLHVCSPVGYTTGGYQQTLDDRLPAGMELPTTQPANLRAEAERRR